MEDGNGDEIKPGASPSEEGVGGSPAGREPSWRGAVAISAGTAAVAAVILLLVSKAPVGQALVFAGVLFLVSIPLNYYGDRYLYRRRLARSAAAGEEKR